MSPGTPKAAPCVSVASFTQVLTLTESGGQGGVEQSPPSTRPPSTPFNAAPLPTSPTGYRIDPVPTAIIIPSTVSVRVIANLQAGGSRWWDLVKTNQQEQSQIGSNQFALRRELPPTNWAQWLPDDWATSIDVLLPDALDPRDAAPGPPKFDALLGPGVVSSVDIVVTYWARRNADIHRGNSSTGRDDVVRVDYNSRNVLEVGLKLSEFEDYMEDMDGNYIVPAPPPTAQTASLHDTVTVRNSAG